MKKKLVLALITTMTVFSFAGCNKAFTDAVKDVVVETVKEELSDEMSNTEVKVETEVEPSLETTEENKVDEVEEKEKIEESVILEEAEPIEDGVYNEDIISKSLPTDNVKLTVTLGGSTYESIVNRPDIMVTTTQEGISAEVYYVDGIIYTHSQAFGMDLWFKVTDASGDYVSNSFPTGAVGIEADKITDFEYVESVNEDGLDLDVVKVTYDTDKGSQITTLYIDPTTGIAHKMVTDTTEGEGVVYIEKGASFTLPEGAKNALPISAAELAK